MSSSWQKFEELIKQEMRKVYSEPVVEHSMDPRNLGVLEEADGYARVTGPCGDTMSIWLKVSADTIVNASFTTDGCGPTLASGSMITEMVKGQRIREARKITQHAVLDALGGLPQENEHCALLAANTLNAAIRDYITTKQKPLKRAYRKQSVG